jgi:hypothetical protein
MQPTRGNFWYRMFIACVVIYASPMFDSTVLLGVRLGHAVFISGFVYVAYAFYRLHHRHGYAPNNTNGGQ